MTLSPRSALASIGFVIAALFASSSEAALTVTPLTWNIIGLDSNRPLSGPKNFPVGARVCSSVATSNVSAMLIWDSTNAFIGLRPGTLNPITIASLPAGGCKDVYFEVEVTQTAAAFNTARRYHITATDASGAGSTTIPRELYVEHLISQSRNAILDVKLDGVSVPAGGSMNLVVGNTYVIDLVGSTAPAGYGQFEAFINFPNTIFQVLSVSTTYSADDSPFVPSPNPSLYADACGWENDPNSPSYRSCVGGDFKAGGSMVVTTYTIKIVSGGGTSQPLNTLLYDFSGSSFHYNADFSTGARIANIIDPAAVTIAKAFAPNPTSVGGVSTLTFTINNPNAGTITGVNFTDTFPTTPGAMTVAAVSGAATSGCGTPTFSPVAGAGSISFSNGTLAANSSCTVSVKVTVPTAGTYTNTSNNLFVGAINTGRTATATLTVSNAPPAPAAVCGNVLAQWRFPSGFTLASPAPTVANVTASASPGLGLSNPTVYSTNSTTPATTGDGTISWGSNGGFAPGMTLNTANQDYFEFAINTTGMSTVFLTFDALFKTPNGPKGLAVFYGTTQPAPGASDPGTAALPATSNAMTAQNVWNTFGSGNSISLSGAGLNASGTTFVRIYGFNAGNDNPGADLNIDNVSFTGCFIPLPPTISKSFSPSPVAVLGSSTLTFNVTNPNQSLALTGLQFTDTLPAGLTVVTAASAQCGGTLTTTAPSTISFAGGSRAAGASCAITVTVTATTSGPHSNVSGFISSTEGGTNSGTTGVATATLTAVLPPVIAKQFAPSPILPGGTSTLTFTITNPNQNDILSGVAFSDTFPTSPAAMTVAGSPGATTSGCGAPLFSPVAAAGSISFSGGTLAGGGTCTVTVNVTAPVAGTYNNTSGNVSHSINAVAVNGLSASASLTVNAPTRGIALLKQVSLSASGPWSSFLAVSTGPVHYRFTVENTGDVPLSPISITDNTLNVSSCNAAFAAVTLQVAVAANDNHIATCITGPIAITSGLHSNTASATGTFAGVTTTSSPSTATYATTGLTLVKNVTQTFFTNAGDSLNYSYTVTNSGSAPLAGPVTVADNKVAVTCPSVTTVGDFDNFLEINEILTCNATYIITAGDVAATSVTNTASATAGGVTSPQVSRTVNAGQADVAITKTLSTAAPFTTGQTITYSLVVSNNGPSTATNVQVSDTPTNLTIGTVSGGCATLPCTIANLASGANAMITVTATINAAGAFDNAASVVATQSDPVPANNTDNSGNGGTATTSSADVAISKTLVTAAPFTIGQTVTYSLVVSNNGPSTATNVQVSDTPTNLTIATVSGACATLPCTIANLASGANATITVTATINAAGAFDNAATATAAQTDPVPANNTDNTGNGGTAASSADVSISKTLVTAAPFTIGQTVTYTLVVSNNGPSAATNVQVSDTPTNLTIATVSGACATLPCTIANLASGANATITVTATITAAGAFDNAATATATQTDPVPANNTDNTGNGGTATSSADVAMSKTLVTAAPFTIGQTITYSLVVSNNGPSTATNVQVSDTPTNLTIATVSGACATLPCTIANLASGATATITVTATINAAGAFDNAATATATQTDPVPANNTDNTGNGGTTAVTADVSISKTLVTAAPFTTGQTITYSLVVSNNGPSAATNVQVSDTPTNLTIATVSGACATLPCTIANLASGANATITVTATINAAGAFDNAATATATQTDPVPANNTDNTGNGGTTAVTADVATSKTLVTAAPFTIGQTLTYTLVVSNNGPSTATNVQVSDTPTNLTIATVSGACATLPCTIVSIASGATATITVTATINAAGAFDNAATATAAQTDPVPANNTDNTGNGGTVFTADLAILKTDNSTTYTPGAAINYTITVTNNGPSTVTSMTVTDAVPAAITSPVFTANTGAYNSVTGAWTGLNLAAGQSVTLTLSGTVSAGASGNLVNTATVAPPAGTTDPTSGNNSSTDTDTTVPAAPTADLAIFKNDNSATYTAGAAISYTITVFNNGPSTVTSLTVTDTVPAAITAPLFTANSGTYNSATAAWTGLNLAAGQSVTLTLSGTVSAGAAGNLVNTATVAPPSGTTDPTPGNNSSTDTDTLAQTPPTADLSILKSDNSATYTPGDVISYTIIVTNNGPSTVTSMTVIDAVPAAITTPLFTASTGTYNSATGAWSGLNLAAGQSVSLTLVGTVSPSATGNLVNMATVAPPSGTTDPTPGNDSSTDTDASSPIPPGPVSDLAIIKSDGSATYKPGPITYTMTVTNNGPESVASVTVRDAVPPAITSPLFTTSAGNYDPATGLWTGLNLAAGQSVTLTLSGIVSARSTGNLVNVAAVTPPSGTTDPTPGNDSSTDSDLPELADLSIENKVDNRTPSLGMKITYTITLSNAGPNPATNVRVFDMLPVGLQFVSATTQTGAYDPATGLWTIPTVGVGTSVRLVIEVIVLSTANTTVAEVVASDQFDPDSVPNNGMYSEDDLMAVNLALIDAAAIPTLSELSLLISMMLMAIAGFVALRRVA
ncbi:MAG TPA: hypothetical protein VNM92_00825 [Thermoanaerobaculia bacterium]|nr:hypothetical protein [Thermoanaerobaculia bacterium]